MSKGYDLFQPFSVNGAAIDSLVVNHTKHMIEQLAAETERWMRKALENGPGWNVWRSLPGHKDGDIFVITHQFALVPPGAQAPGEGYLFTQPDFTDGERVRLLAGRHDWREQNWQDECGVPDCGHPCCERYRA